MPLRRAKAGVSIALGDLRRRSLHRRPAADLVEPGGEWPVRAPPRNLRQAEIEISKRTRERDIAEIEPIVHRGDDVERPRNCTALPRYPIVPTPLRRPATLDHNRERGIDQSLHHCNPRHHLEAIIADERAAMAHRVKIFAD